MKKLILAGLLLAGTACGAAMAADSVPTIVHAGALLDQPGKAPRGNASIIIQDGKVSEIRDGFANIPGAAVVDLKDQFVLPGLIDLHVHLIYDGVGAKTQLDLVTRSAADWTVEAAINAEKDLLAGFTTVRDLGDQSQDGRAARAVRNAVNAGRLRGPSILAAAIPISATAGHMDINGYNDDVGHALDEHNVCNGVEDCRRAVREQVKRGADVIKLATTGGVLSQIAAGTGQQLYDDEIKAIVETGHMYGKKVTAHAHGTAGINAALRAGVDSVEHGSYQDAESIKLFKQTGAWYVPTLLAGETTMEMARTPGALSPEQAAKALAVGPSMAKSLTAAYKAGVKIGFGTDTGVSKHGDNAREFKLMVNAGMPAADAIKSATIDAATAQGIESKVGSLAVGKNADIIAVAKSPLDDITQLERVTFVMRQGVVHKQNGQPTVFIAKP